MGVPKSLGAAKGSWKGKSRLNLPWLAPEKRITESVSSLHVDVDPLDKFATVTYVWSHEGKRHEGAMLVCGSSKTAEIGWVDSWHMTAGVLHTKGEIAADGSFKTKGTYSAGKEDWGWTIAFSLVGDALTLRMENVTPKGEAEWAVQATYHRD